MTQLSEATIFHDKECIYTHYFLLPFSNKPMLGASWKMTHQIFLIIGSQMTVSAQRECNMFGGLS